MKEQVVNLRDKVWSSAEKETKKSWAWYESHVRAAAGRMSRQKFLGDNHTHQIQRTSITPGDMIFYFYDPKTKETLPYYDTSPLLLPFSISEDGKSFLGLNLHYLKPVVRATLLDSLMKYVDDDKMRQGTKIQASWALLKSVAGSEVAKHCVKRYLFTHVKSNAVVIPPKEWEYIVWLPLENFTSKTGTINNETVWSKV